MFGGGVIFHYRFSPRNARSTMLELVNTVGFSVKIVDIYFVLKSKKRLDFISIVGADNEQLFPKNFRDESNTQRDLWTGRNKVLLTNEYHAPCR